MAAEDEEVNYESLGEEETAKVEENKDTKK